MAERETPILDKEKEEVKEEVKENPKPKENEPRFIVGTVTKETELAIVDVKENIQYTELTILAKIANDIEEMKKLL